MSETKSGDGGSNRPSDSAFKQQRLEAWQPILTPKWVIGTFAVVGLIFLPLGFILLGASDGVVELSHNYGAASACSITKANQNRSCTFTLTIKKAMAKPVFVYYELTNFYQNHRRYVKSRSDPQLRGDMAAGVLSGLQSSCDPLYQFNNSQKVLWPCGLIANSFFNDKIILDAGTTQPMLETGIAWKSDLDKKFANPTVRDTAKYRYLDQQYPAIIPPFTAAAPQAAGTGVRNEHFIVWMRTAGLPTFRKLYGRIEQDLPAGSTVTFTIQNNFDVSSFGGSKTLVLSTTSWLGGKNPFLGIAYIAVGALCLLLAAAFFAKHKMAPRDLGDTRYLVWKNRQ